IPVAGLSIHRENRLQPYLITTPMGHSSFFLKDSTVDVIVNGHRIRTLQLKAGPHEIGDFPLSRGANDVVLRITDKFGHVEYSRATFFTTPRF
ncbi:MAG: fimbrial biogenesis outer membrane usher protein, partial [Verrucomicrobiae bacterium]|nr:fimbrial biogenesis outer membrane usher protein [Verrucomicrobiae bacterium]